MPVDSIALNDSYVGYATPTPNLHAEGVRSALLDAKITFSPLTQGLKEEPCCSCALRNNNNTCIYSLGKCHDGREPRDEAEEESKHFLAVKLDAG